MKRTNGYDKFAIAMVILVVLCAALSGCAGTARGFGEFFAGVGDDIKGFAKGSTEAQAKEYDKQKEYEAYLISTGRLAPR